MQEPNALLPSGLYSPPRSCSWHTWSGESVRRPTGIMQGELPGMLANHFERQRKCTAESPNSTLSAAWQFWS